MRFRKLVSPVAALTIVACFLAVLLLAGCGGGSSQATATAEARPKSVPPLFHQKDYDVTIFTGWPQDVSDRRTGSYLESAWHDPADSEITIAINSRASADAGSPLAAAELARMQMKNLPGYQEHHLEKVEVEGRPMIRWGFKLAGEGRVDYFFAECGTSFMVLGASPPERFEPLSKSFETMTSTIKPVCDQ